MEQQVAETGHAAGMNFVSDCAKIRNISMSTMCVLPMGRPTICGDARHREERAPDSAIVVGGAVDRDVWFIRSGILRLQRYGYDGRRQILSLYLPGEIIGFGREFREGVSVEAVTKTELCRIDRRKFEAMLSESDELRTGLFRQKLAQLDRLHWLTGSLGALTPDQRFCAFLALSTQFMPCHPLPDGTIVLSMQLPRADIADLLGTSVETICRINKKLSDAGVIDLKDSSHFRILDLEKMKSLGQIKDSFERMVRGIAGRRSRLDRLAGLPSGGSICFCGR